jgi:signal transduction histidine kinase
LRNLGYIGSCFRGEDIRGEVYLWGKVIEHQSGWRAQFAYPKTLVLPESLLFGRFAQLELGDADAELMTYLNSLTAYESDIFWAPEPDIFWAQEKKQTLLWRARSGYETGGLESLRESLHQALRESWAMWWSLRSDTHLPGSSRLSLRELKIVKYVAQGLSNSEISKHTGIGLDTVINCLSSIFDKLGVSTRLELLSLTLPKKQHKQLRMEVEENRVVREVHDGTLIQSLLAMVMRLDPLPCQFASQASVAEELRRIQDVLRQEAQKMRDFMRQTKPLEVDAKNLRSRLRELVERFERETGISTQMVSEPAEVNLSRWVCGVVLRILQEALVNVRRHSGANNVLVQFRRTGNHWQLAVEDDGSRFPFSGRFSQKELEASGRGPLVIKECVLSIGGELMIETIPGRVSRLEITIPAKRRAAYWRKLGEYLVSVGRWTLLFLWCSSRNHLTCKMGKLKGG